METRKIVDEKIDLRIGKQPAETYKKEFTWKDLQETEGVLPTDIIWHFFYRQERETGMFSMKMEDELIDYYWPIMQVCRKRPETDDEFLARKTREQESKNKTEEQEKLEYLRLKAKFETNAVEKQGT